LVLKNGGFGATFKLKEERQGDDRYNGRLKTGKAGREHLSILPVFETAAGVPTQHARQLLATQGMDRQFHTHHVQRDEQAAAPTRNLPIDRANPWRMALHSAKRSNQNSTVFSVEE
jgi:hypothetical protein